jgi:hypothetical protein
MNTVNTERSYDIYQSITKHDPHIKRDKTKGKKLHYNMYKGIS